MTMRDRDEGAPSYYNTQKRNRRPYRPVESSPRFLLSNMFFPSMFYSYLSSLSSSSTTTTYLILNSTLTTTVVTSCVYYFSSRCHFDQCMSKVTRLSGRFGPCYV